MIGGWLGKRLSEPSTHAGVAGLLLIGSQLLPQYALIFQGLSAVLFGTATVKSDPGHF